jgi:hypothetical protein
MSKQEDPTLALLILFLSVVALIGIIWAVDQPVQETTQSPQVVGTYKDCELVRFNLPDQAKFVHVLYCPTK